MLTSKDDRKTKRSDCISIKAKNPNSGYEDSHYKCSFKEDDDNKCMTEKKTCEEIMEGKSACEFHVLDDPYKQCKYKNNGCVEEYINCDIYNDHHGSDPLV